jgi:phage tail-like protein
MSGPTAIFSIFGPNITDEFVRVPPTGMRVGRSADNELVLASSEISRHHMRFEWINGDIAVRDLNSSNGIWFNDQRLKADVPQVIQPGESIRMGPFVMRLESIELPAGAAGPEPEPAALEPLPEPEEGEDSTNDPAYVAEPTPPAKPVPDQTPVGEVIPEEEYQPVTSPPSVIEKLASAAEKVLDAADEAAQEITAPPAGEKPKKKPKDEPKEEGKSFLFTPLEPGAPSAEPAPEKQPKKKDAEKPAPAPTPLEPPPVAEKPKAKPKEEPPAPKSEDPFERMPERIGGDGASLIPQDPLPPIPATNGHSMYPVGMPRDASTWMKYLPGIYLDDDFLGRYLILAEAMMSPAIWIIDNLDMYYTPEVAPLEWVRWLAGVFDIYISEELPAERQRLLFSQAGWLAARRGTRAGMERLLELYTGVRPEIIEEPAHFTVRIELSSVDTVVTRAMLERLIVDNKPAFASYSLEIT